MKRIIGLSLLFLANIVVLAHAVIPHDHHGKICISICNILSVSDTLNHKHESCRLGCGEHAHSGHSSKECTLNDLYTRSNESSVSSGDSDFTNFHSDFPVICYDAVPLLEIQFYEELSFRQKPYLNSYYTYYLTHSLGLRAPPSC